MEGVGLRALLRSSGCAVERGRWLFLCDPGWSRAEAEAANAQIATAGRAELPAGQGWLCVRTGGSAGGVRFARHDEATLSAAVAGFRRHFDFAHINTVNVLPPWHVGGLMPQVRSAMTGGKCVAWDWPSLERGITPNLPVRPDGWVISLVPTQLSRLLEIDRTVGWLRGLRLILVGGGPSWPALSEKAARAGLPVALSYGLTETAAAVAALLPTEFSAGARSCGAALPHARLSVTGEGTVNVAGESVFRGYFPDWHGRREFGTDDLGRIDERGHLQLFGRRDALIITGGRKVSPEEVEALLRASGEFRDVVVLGVPDPDWGEIVVACFPPAEKPLDIARATRDLAPHMRPKRFVAIADWNRSSQGKINRAALRVAVQAAGTLRGTGTK